MEKCCNHLTSLSFSTSVCRRVFEEFEGLCEFECQDWGFRVQMIGKSTRWGFGMGDDDSLDSSLPDLWPKRTKNDSRGESSFLLVVALPSVQVSFVRRSSFQDSIVWKSISNYTRCLLLVKVQHPKHSKLISPTSQNGDSRFEIEFLWGYVVPWWLWLMPQRNTMKRHSTSPPRANPPQILARAKRKAGISTAQRQLA
jgi:hypothetical protein